MKATIPTLDVASASVAQIAVGQVNIGPIAVGQLLLRNTSVALNAANAVLENVVVTVSLRFDFDWHVHIPLPWPFDDIDVGGSVFIGSVSIPFAFGTMQVPGLRNINLTIPQMSGANAQVQADPLAGLGLSSVVADGVHATGMTAPVPDFSLNGIGLSTVSVDGVALPAAHLAAANVAHLHGAPLIVPALVLKGLSLPRASASDVASGPLDVPLTKPPLQLGPINLGILQFTLRITPSARAQVARMTLSGVDVAATVGAVELHNISLPYDALNLTLSDIGIRTIAVPTIGVA